MQPKRLPIVSPISVLLPLTLATGLVGCHSIPSPLKRGTEATEQKTLGTSENRPSSTSATADLSTVASQPMPKITSKQIFGTHIDLGRILESKGELEAAEASYRQATQLEKRRLNAEQRALAYRKLAVVLDRQGKFDESEPNHQEALRLGPKDPKVWNDAGYSAYLRGDWDLAIERLQRAARLDSDDPRILTNLGLATAASGNTEKALEQLTRATGSGAAHANLGYILAASGREEEALQHYTLAAEQAPNLQVARDALARLNAPLSSTTEPSPMIRQDPTVAPASLGPLRGDFPSPSNRVKR